MASKQDIEQVLSLLKNKFDEPDFKKRFATFSKTMQFTFPDIETTFLITVTEGAVESIEEKQIDNPDIIVTVDSDTFIDIIHKKMNPMKAFSTGKLKAKGKLIDLLNLQKIL